MRVRVLLAAGLFALPALADDPFAMLERMSRSVRTLDYRGTFSYQQGQELSSVRLVHAVVDGKEQERVVHLDGDMREILRHDHDVECIHLGNRLLRLDPDNPSHPAVLGAARAPAALGDYYAVEQDGSERIAGRLGDRLVVSPRDPYRYGMTLVLDRETALLLKSETTDGAGRVLERFQFVDVTIGPVPRAALAAETTNPRVIDAHAATHVRPVESSRAFDWTVSWLPAGFALTARDTRESGKARTPVEVQLYSDGLAAFSVFVEKPGQGDAGHAGHASQGATVAYVTARGAGHVVTVVGEIPVETAQLVANAVNFPAAGL